MSGRPLLKGLLGVSTAGAAFGAGCLAYAHWVELEQFTLRHRRVALPGIQSPLRVLHISDIHYVPGQQRKLRWLQSLADLRPDLVINTGDNLSHQDAVPHVLEALTPLLRFPGVFVGGSNDYYAPQMRNPLRYFAGPSKLQVEPAPLPTEDLFSAFVEAGWTSLNNAHTSIQLADQRVEFTGVDDPHIDLDAPAGWPASAADPSAKPALKIGVAHAPLERTLGHFTADGADLIFAGHTHGGQICLPGGKALVTNCDLPTRYAKGLHTRPRPDGGTTHVHVSAGIGTSAKAPIRFFCPPEATLLTLTPASR